MNSAWPCEVSAEWWDAFDAGEGWTLASSKDNFEKDLPSCCDWIDSKAEEQSPLLPSQPPADDRLTDIADPPVPSCSTETFEGLFLGPFGNEAVSESPGRSAFKESFCNRSPSPAAMVKSNTSSLVPLTPSAEAISTCSTQTASKANVAINLQPNAQESADSHSQQKLDGVLLIDQNISAAGVIDTPERTASKDGATDGGPEGLLDDGLVDVDLQCSGEELNFDCDEDGSNEPSLSWILGGSRERLSFIPIDNTCCRSMLETSSGQSLNDLVDNNTAREAAKLPEMISVSAVSLSRTESSCSPAQSFWGSSKSETSAEEDHVTEREAHEESELTAVASTNALSEVQCSGPRKRPGRPSKRAAAAKESRQAAAGKRKRAMICKPAAPLITPVWRAGPEGPKTLCNACGVRYMKVAKKK